MNIFKKKEIKKDRRWLVIYKYFDGSTWKESTVEAHVNGGTDGNDLWSWYALRKTV